MSYAFPLALIFAGMGFLYTQRRYLLVGWRSYFWQTTGGLVVESDDKSFHSPGVTGLAGEGVGELRPLDREYIYRYTVAGTVYESNQYCFGGWAENLGASFAIGDAVKVYYDPKNPQQAVLRRGIPVVGIVGLAPIILGIVILAWPKSAE